MIYVFDTSSLSNLKHFYPAVFTTVWSELDRMIGEGDLISTKEVWNEMQRGNPAQHTNAWLEAAILNLPPPRAGTAGGGWLGGIEGLEHEGEQVVPRVKR